MIETKKRYLPSFALFFISIFTFFLLGIYSSDYLANLNVKNIGEDGFLLTNQEDLNLKKFWSVYSTIKQEYYSADDVSKVEIVDGAIKGMVEALGDKHSEFFTTAETQRFNEVLSGDFEGIGAVVEKVDFGVIIDRVLKGSPAKKFGLKKGDIIIKADENELSELSLYDAVDKIKGPATTGVLLTILRSGEKDMLEIEVVRQKIKIPSVESEIFEEEQFGYISINMFGDDTSIELKKALETFENTNGIIIDLRDNGGGYLLSAVEILSHFVPSGEKLVTTKYKTLLKSRVYKSFDRAPFYDKKIVILINENSASASEITAGALRDYNKAILVGKKSYGKGSVQEPFDLIDGSMVKLTIAKWFTPKGKNIDEEGIVPDIEIDLKKQDYNFEECQLQGVCDDKMQAIDFKFYDRQLEEAKKVLKKFIEIDALQLTIDKYNGENIEKE